MPDFSNPLFLLLLPLPFLVARLLPPLKGRGGALIVPGSISRRLSVRSEKSSSALRWMLPAILWVLLVVALAGPRVVVTNLAALSSGREIVLALDLSGSMITPDFEIDGKKARRIDAVKHVATEFVRGRKGDRVSLVLFGSEAYFATPQSFDVEAVAEAIEEATIGISGRATGISNALGLALKRLETVEATSKVVILLSDGVNNAGPVKPRDAAQLASDLNVRVHTIALGPELDPTAESAQRRGKVDVETLQAIARISGGTAFRVETTADLQTVTDAIDRLESDDRDGPPAELYRDLWVWPATLAFLIALLLPFRRRTV